MLRRHPTVDELVATLRRSQLPTVVVEGKDDIHIYRWVEARISNRYADVLSTGGRDVLFEVYQRRNEFPNLPVAFVADRDLWLFSGIPANHDDVIWTQGYSIENDLYAGANLEKLLDSDEASEHEQILLSIIQWFAFEVEEHLAGREAQVARHCNEIVPLDETRINQRFCEDREFRPAKVRLVQQIKEAYQLQLRGKLLFQLLARFLSASDRRAKHSILGLHEIALKTTNPHPLMDQLIGEIEERLRDSIPLNSRLATS